MTERSFDTGYWTHPFTQGLKTGAMLLYVYLWTNTHCNQAGLYKITYATMAFQTGIPDKDLPALLRSLEKKVAWYPEHNLIWVRNFLKHQARSPKFVIGAIKCLNGIPADIRAEFELYNEALLRGVSPSHGISLTRRECVIIRDSFICQYCGKEITEGKDFEMDHVIPVSQAGRDNYLNLVASCLTCNQKKLDRTPAEAGMKEPNPSTFHGAQALYILRTNEGLRAKWLDVFPNRERVVELMLNDVGQRQSSENNIGRSILANVDEVGPLTLPHSLLNSNSVTRSEVVSGRGGSGGGTRIEDEGIIFQLLVDTFRRGWGWMPKSRETAQLRDLGAELAAVGVTEAQVVEAFKEAAVAGEGKLKVSYVRAIILDWLGVKR